MSYCSLEEAWGPNSICSRVKKTTGNKGDLSYTITNEKECNENNFMYNDLEDNYSLLPQNNNNNNRILDINTKNTIVNQNQELDINPNDTTFFGYQNIPYTDKNSINENNNMNENKNNINESIIEENNNMNDNSIEENNNMNESIIDENNNIEGFANNNNNLENFTTTLDDIMKRLDAIESKLSNSNNKQKNVHDIILYIIIGVFILFALDSIFKIGRLTV